MKQLTLSERKTLKKHLETDLFQNEIASIMNRSGSTISEEIRRCGMTRETYCPNKAHNDAVSKQANHAKSKKLDLNPELRKKVEKMLKSGLTPEMIAGYLKSLNQAYVCAETIYQTCYSGEKTDDGTFWYTLLLWRKKQGKRIPRGSRKKRFRIPDRTSIHQRPEYINDRSEFGHWEADLIQGVNGYIMIATERKSRFSTAVLMKSKTANEMYDALCSLIDYGQNLKSITFDNGSENVCHVRLKNDLPWLLTFFCDPYSGWQKGTTERINRDYRQYFPSSLDFATISQADVEKVSHWRNHRPLKTLKFLSPKSVFDHSVNS